MSDERDHRVVLYFQEGPGARRRRTAAAPSLFDPPPAVELPMREVGELFQTGLKRHGVTLDEAARLMAISRSLLGRQIRNEDNQHLSFQRVAAFLRGDVTRDVLIEVLTRRQLVDIHRPRPRVRVGGES